MPFYLEKFMQHTPKNIRKSSGTDFSSTLFSFMTLGQKHNTKNLRARNQTLHQDTLCGKERLETKASVF